MNQTQKEDATVQIPMKLVEECVEFKEALFVYGWLAAHECDAVSLESVAVHCGISPLEAFRSIAWLEARGWIELYEDPGKTSPCPVVTASTERA
jgi:hypothetical protein